MLQRGHGLQDSSWERRVWPQGQGLVPAGSALTPGNHCAGQLPEQKETTTVRCVSSSCQELHRVLPAWGLESTARLTPGSGLELFSHSRLVCKMAGIG